MSRNFGVDYFLDGRRNALASNEEIPGAAIQPAYSFDEPQTPKG